SQAESIKLTSPPRPASLPVSADIDSRNSVPVVVTVKLTQCESGTWAAPKNASGLPNLGIPYARRFHSAQDWPTRCARGASVIDPTEISAVCDPNVSSTRSSGATVTEVTAPSRSLSSRLTVMRPGDVAKPTSWTKTPVWRFTPRLRSQLTSGSMKVSYWSNG